MFQLRHNNHFGGRFNNGYPTSCYHYNITVMSHINCISECISEARHYDRTEPIQGLFIKGMSKVGLAWGNSENDNIFSAGLPQISMNISNINQHTNALRQEGVAHEINHDLMLNFSMTWPWTLDIHSAYKYGQRLSHKEYSPSSSLSPDLVLTQALPTILRK